MRFEPSEDPGPLVLCGETKRRLELVELELRHVPRFLACGIDAPTRLLFTGPTGTGKTLAARHVACRLRRPLVVLEVAEAMSSFLGTTGQNLARAFAAATDAILFLDEIEAVSPRRGTAVGDAGREMERATTVLLQEFDKLGPDRIVIAATNFPDALDSAFRRRFTTEIAFELPDYAARREMIGAWLAKAPVLPCQLDGLAERLDGLGGAEVRTRAMAYAREMIMAQPAPPPPRVDRKALAAGARGLLDTLNAL